MAAARIHPHNPARIQRALEVYRHTGRPLSALWSERSAPAVADGPVLTVGLAWSRPALYERINRRVETMLAAGWIDEVRRILAMGYAPGLKPLRAIGYREIVALLQGERDETGLAADIAQRTRRYAKRQLTWFRKHEEIAWMAPADTDAVLRRVDAFLGGT